MDKIFSRDEMLPHGADLHYLILHYLVLTVAFAVWTCYYLLESLLLPT